ncbi:hypothetical protein, partial [Bordetella pertussis]|uniref:hypothetical protein n=1 Tax=Bordetella pertussis TaxID=520 RepID=UPI0021CB3AE5
MLQHQLLGGRGQRRAAVAHQQGRQQGGLRQAGGAQRRLAVHGQQITAADGRIGLARQGQPRVAQRPGRGRAGHGRAPVAARLRAGRIVAQP